MANLEVARVSKRFGSLQALDDVSISLRAGEVHAIVGENGAGKSTLMNVIAGFLVPDSGQVLIDGIALPFGQPTRIRTLGVSMVHQHFTLVPNLTVRENLALAHMPNLLGRLNLKELAEPALKLAEALGWTFDPDGLAGNLSLGSQQQVEILKSLAGDEQVVLFDEPTAPLAGEEVADLLRVLRDLAEQGRTVALIAHKLPEVFAVADRITVLRRARMVGESMTSAATADAVAELMVGKVPPVLPINSTAGKEVIRARELYVEGARGEKAVQGVGFAVREGEIFGVGGVDGNGQLELAEALAGIRPASEGELSLPPKIAYIPADRQREGLAMGMSISDNLFLGPLTRDNGRFDYQRLRRWAERMVVDYRIKVGRLSDSISSLSGGNQQKVVVARNLDDQPNCIVAVNPIRGLDIRAARFVHDELRKAKQRGAAIVLFSADTDELAELADRTVFLNRGRFVEGSLTQALVGDA